MCQLPRTIMIVLLVCACGSLLMSQTIKHPWWVVDNGGGKSYGGSLILTSSIGQPAVSVMTGGNIKIASGYLPGVQQLSGVASTAQITVNEKWNMVSVPVKKDDMSKTTLFPHATTKAFYFENAYLQKDTMVFGKGYWLKFPATETITFSGTPVSVETIDVANNWNMIGSLSNNVAVANIQAIGTSIASSYFGFVSGSGYTSTTTLAPGKGYWIKLSSTGKLVLRSSSILGASTSPSISSAKGKTELSSTTSNENTSIVHALLLKDALGRERKLYFGSAKEEIDASQYELPPLPPAGIFDVRFTTQQSTAMLNLKKNQEQTFTVAFQAAVYPVTVTWENSDNAILLIDKTSLPMTPAGKAVINSSESRVKIKILSASIPELPKEYALQQNYPNPFNPSTVIKYSLPVNDMVTLKIYNTLGQEVATLVEELQDVGFKSIEWNASDVPSGIYFYRLTAGSFTDTKKLVLIK